MSKPKALPPIPFAPAQPQPFCLVDGDTGLVLAPSRKVRTLRSSRQVTVGQGYAPKPVTRS